jgi:hypothetical protein
VLWVKATGMPLRPPGGGIVARAPDQLPAKSPTGELSYAWQLYLPRLPFLTDQFGFWPPDGTWLRGFAGRYGWLDYEAPGWVIDLVRVVVLIGIALFVSALLQFRDAVWRARALVVALAVFTVALLAVIAHQGYDYRRTTGFIFEQARYLFPLAAIWSAAVATACLGLGRRIAPILAAIAITLFCLHDLSGVFVTLARYYG